MSADDVNRMCELLHIFWYNKKVLGLYHPFCYVFKFDWPEDIDKFSITAALVVVPACSSQTGIYVRISSHEEVKMMDIYKSLQVQYDKTLGPSKTIE